MNCFVRFSSLYPPYAASLLTIDACLSIAYADSAFIIIPLLTLFCCYNNLSRANSKHFNLCQTSFFKYTHEAITVTAHCDCPPIPHPSPTNMLLFANPIRLSTRLNCQLRDIDHIFTTRWDHRVGVYLQCRLLRCHHGGYLHPIFGI